MITQFIDKCFVTRDTSLFSFLTKSLGFVPIFYNSVFVNLQIIQLIQKIICSCLQYAHTLQKSDDMRPVPPWKLAFSYIFVIEVRCTERNRKANYNAHKWAKHLGRIACPFIIVFKYKFYKICLPNPYHGLVSIGTHHIANVCYITSFPLFLIGEDIEPPLVIRIPLVTSDISLVSRRWFSMQSRARWLITLLPCFLITSLLLTVFQICSNVICT